MTGASRKSATGKPARSANGRPGKSPGLKEAASTSAVQKTSASKPASSRALRAAERREAIVGAGLEEFIARGFAATRLDDVARRAGVAKGTIYLHFKDKEALFQELVRTMLSPVVKRLEALRASDAPIRIVLERFADLFVREIYGTRRRDVARLIITEGARFPTI